jgi:hypothetical protein
MFYEYLYCRKNNQEEKQNCSQLCKEGGRGDLTVTDPKL